MAIWDRGSNPFQNQLLPIQFIFTNPWSWVQSLFMLGSTNCPPVSGGAPRFSRPRDPRQVGRGVQAGRGWGRGASLAPSQSYVTTGKIKGGVPPDVEVCLPKARKACTTGWKEKVVPTFALLTEEENQAKFLGKSLLNSYLHIEKSTTAHLRSRGLNPTPANALQELISLRVF